MKYYFSKIAKFLDDFFWPFVIVAGILISLFGSLFLLISLYTFILCILFGVSFSFTIAGIAFIIALSILCIILFKIMSQ